MAYDVDFWYISQDACQISTDFTPFSEHGEESIYMKTSDFFEMIERFTDPDLECKAKAWEQFKNDYHTEITQAIDNLFKLNNMDIAGETIFLLEKILSDLDDE